MSLASGAYSKAMSTNESKQTINVKLFSRMLKAENIFSANFFREMVETKSDHHKILHFTEILS